MYERVMSGLVKTGQADGSVESSFDAILSKPDTAAATAHAPWRLTISLRINLRQLNPNPWPTTTDSDGRPFWIDRWTLREWEQFKRGAASQAARWNNQFCLKPPPTFMDGDILTSGRVWRPYVDCHFAFRFYDFAPDAHRTIRVAKLNASYAKNQATAGGLLPDGTPDGETFRSNSVLWDSYDLIPSIAMRFDFNGMPSAGDVERPTIAHEIGHALGLGHVGVMRSTPLCVMAQRLGWPTASGSLQSSLFAGGKASSVCYGEWHADPSVAGDIMGMGATFSALDGLPWVWAIQQLRNQPWEPWDVVLKSEHSETGRFVI